MIKQSAISRSTKNTVRALAGAVALFGALEFAQATSVVDPALPVAGKSQLELSQQWWQWVLSIPASGNPQFDTDGLLAQTNNNGPVFFVAGNFGGTSTRTFTVPVGRPIFFPVLNNTDLEFPQFTPNCNTNPSSQLGTSFATSLECALSFISPALEQNKVTNLHATLDGHDLLTFPSYRQTSTSLFDIILPDDNLFSGLGIGAGDYPGIAVSDGYWIALDSLSPGQHNLIFGGTNGDGFTLEVTDTLNVPEPGTLSLLFLGSLAALGYRRFGIGSKRI